MRWAVLALALCGLATIVPARAETVRVTVTYYSAATGPYFEKMAAAFHAANPDIDVPTGTVQSAYSGTDSIIMFSNSKVKQAAWKFLDFLFTKEPRVEFTTGEGCASSDLDVRSIHQSRNTHT